MYMRIFLMDSIVTTKYSTCKCVTMYGSVLEIWIIVLQYIRYLDYSTFITIY